MIKQKLHCKLVFAQWAERAQVSSQGSLLVEELELELQ